MSEDEVELGFCPTEFFNKVLSRYGRSSKHIGVCSYLLFGTVYIPHKARVNSSLRGNQNEVYLVDVLTFFDISIISLRNILNNLIDDRLLQSYQMEESSPGYDKIILRWERIYSHTSDSE